MPGGAMARPWRNALSLLVFVLLFRFPDAQECAYNKCIWKDSPWILHEPCGNTDERNLVRTVTCANSSDYHICCDNVAPQKQETRQAWFRSVTALGSKIGRSCMSQILCERSCIDTLNGPSRSDYPEVLPNDSPADHDYIKAYNVGESAGCLRQTDPSFGKDSCVAHCGTKYGSTCSADLESQGSPEAAMTRATIAVAPMFHNGGLKMFDAWIMVQRTAERLLSHGLTLAHALQSGMTELSGKLGKAANDFATWRETYRLHRSEPQSADHVGLAEPLTDTEPQWRLFLADYHKIEPRLVEWLRTITWAEFSNATNVVHESRKNLEFQLHSLDITIAPPSGNFGASFRANAFSLMSKAVPLLTLFWNVCFYGCY